MTIPVQNLLKEHTAGAPIANGDTTFEVHYTIGDLAQRWRLGRETVRLLIKDEPGVVKVRRGSYRSHTRYSVPESVARRLHTRLFNPHPETSKQNN